MRVVVACLLLPLALAGCAAQTQNAETGPESVAEAMAEDGNLTFATEPIVLAPTAGTLHFLGRPTFGLAPPDGPAERVPLPDTTSTFQGNVVGIPANPDSWRIAWPTDEDIVVGNATLWVDVEGPVLNPRGNECFWNVVISFFIDGAGVGFAQCAGMEPPQVPSGPRRLEFEFRYEGDVPAGADLVVEVYAGLGPHAPGTQRMLLVGGPEQASSITFQGVTFGDG